MMRLCPLWPRYKERWNILLLGDSDVGKTSFAYRFSDDVFQESFRKLVFSSEHVKECYFSQDDSCRVCLSDTWVAQSSYTDMDDAIPFSDGIILMYSTTSRISFQDISRTCRQIPLNGSGDNGRTLILVATKSDETHAREVSADDGALLARELGCKAFFETSAKTGAGVDDAVFAMVKALRSGGAERGFAPFRLIARLAGRVEHG